ncbi:MAG: hypothetical protein CBB68_15420 [Rhodospirillaceae bacterium TMED8]|nr:hypothetical protein [Magnetovibrio sp.]OUT47811.1 MAG: hypothetical protein CBB68_15420 [Rhodospirillaceae bacterium TMED8]|tara:strand:- start:426 stop:641 length:216 start_codon:yes stop_codon:yes gene_type:complete
MPPKTLVGSVATLGILRSPKIHTRLFGMANLGIASDEKTVDTTGTDAMKPAVVASKPLDHSTSGNQFFMRH